MCHYCTQGVNTFKKHGGLEGLEGLEYIENESLRAQTDNILEVYFYKEDKELLQVCGSVSLFISCVYSLIW